MYKLICISLALLLTEIRCGYDFHGLDGLHGAPLLDPAIFKSPIIQAPVIPAPTIVKAIAPAPAPIFHGAPVIKAIGPPATSYATVTQVHVTHPAPSFLKAVVAPAPIFKTLALPAPIPLGPHSYPHFSH